jgi:hypothetical protein
MIASTWQQKIEWSEKYRSSELGFKLKMAKMGHK